LRLRGVGKGLGSSDDGHQQGESESAAVAEMWGA
jgi:hypothetical protein